MEGENKVAPLGEAGKLAAQQAAGGEQNQVTEKVVTEAAGGTVPAGQQTQEAPAGKAGEGDAGGKAEDGKADEAKTGAPEKYEAFTMPEGVEVDTAKMAAFEPVARELNLTQEQAQKLVSLYSTQALADAKAAQDAWAVTQADWRKAAETDKDIGGAKFQENVGVAKGVLDKFGTPELRAALDSTGFGNHVELIRILTKVGRAMAEDTIEAGGKPVDGVKSLADRLFPTHTQTK